MRPLAILLAVACQQAEPLADAPAADGTPSGRLSHRITLDEATRGLVMGDKSGVGWAGVDEMVSEFATREGDRLADAKVEDPSSTVLDVADGRALAANDDGTLWVLNRHRHAWLADGVLDARWTQGGVTLLGSEPHGCTVTFPSGDTVPVDGGICDAPAGARSAARHRDALVVGTPEGTVVVAPEATMVIDERPADVAVVDRRLGFVYQADTWGDEVWATTMSGERWWTVAVPGTVRHLADMGAQGLVAAAVSTEERDLLLLLSVHTGEIVVIHPLPREVERLSASADGWVLAASRPDEVVLYNVWPPAE